MFVWRHSSAGWRDYPAVVLARFPFGFVNCFGARPTSKIRLVSRNHMVSKLPTHYGVVGAPTNENRWRGARRSHRSTHYNQTCTVHGHQKHQSAWRKMAIAVRAINRKSSAREHRARLRVTRVGPHIENVAAAPRRKALLSRCGLRRWITRYLISITMHAHHARLRQKPRNQQ